MSEPRTTEELIALIRQGILFGGGSAIEGVEGIEFIATLLTRTASEEFVTVMVDQAGDETEYPGVEGFREALNDWITPYERFRLEIDEVVPHDDRLVFFVRQVGTTKHDGVEIETSSGAVWDLEEGHIARATFYIDPNHARRHAGLDPDSRG